MTGKLTIAQIDLLRRVRDEADFHDQSSAEFHKLQRLAKRGLVKIDGAYSRWQCYWNITDAGRKELGGKGLHPSTPKGGVQ